LGERGRAPRLALGLSIVSCAAVRIDGDLPLVVVRPARSKPFSLPDGMTRRTTELRAFNEKFRLFSVEPYAASALVDARTIAAIHDFDPRFSVEIGGEWVLVHAPRLRAADMKVLIDDAAALARVFPRIARSLYPSMATSARLLCCPDVSLFHRKIKGGIVGTALVVGAEGVPPSMQASINIASTYRPRLNLVVRLPGREPYAAEVKVDAEPNRPVLPDMVLPVVVDPNDPLHLEVDMKQIPRTRDVIRAMTEEEARREAERGG
jgi:hypothetical protein